MRGLALAPFLLALGLAQAPGPEAVLRVCEEVLRGLEVQAAYREGGRLLLVLGEKRPYLVLGLEEGRLFPYPGPPRGRRVARPALVLELTLARRVLEGPRGYRCFLLHRGRVVGVLRLDPGLNPLALPEPLP